jgi:hypothetical protein
VTWLRKELFLVRKDSLLEFHKSKNKVRFT